MVTFHGPMLAYLPEQGLDAFSQQSLMKAIFTPEPVGLLTNPDGVPKATMPRASSA